MGIVVLLLSVVVMVVFGLLSSTVLRDSRPGLATQ